MVMGMAELIDKWEVVNKLIELENWCQQNKPFDGFRNAHLYQKICQLEIAIGKTEGLRWISVKDRLPEVGKKVLVYCKENKNDYEIGAYSDTYRGFFVRQTCYENITHWMPLSQPPKGE